MSRLPYIGGLRLRLGSSNSAPIPQVIPGPAIGRQIDWESRFLTSNLVDYRDVRVKPEHDDKT